MTDSIRAKGGGTVGAGWPPKMEKGRLSASHNHNILYNKYLIEQSNTLIEQSLPQVLYMLATT